MTAPDEKLLLARIAHDAGRLKRRAVVIALLSLALSATVLLLVSPS